MDDENVMEAVRVLSVPNITDVEVLAYDDNETRLKCVTTFGRVNWTIVNKHGLAFSYGTNFVAAVDALYKVTGLSNFGFAVYNWE